MSCNSALATVVCSCYEPADTKYSELCDRFAPVFIFRGLRIWYQVAAKTEIFRTIKSIYLKHRHGDILEIAVHNSPKVWVKTVFNDEHWIMSPISIADTCLYVQIFWKSLSIPLKALIATVADGTLKYTVFTFSDKNKSEKKRLYSLY